MATLKDGLGFEELGDAVDTGSKVAQLFITGSVTAQAGLRDDLGRVRSAVRSHAGSDYGLFVQAGSGIFANDNTATVEFAESFSNANYFLVATHSEFAVGAISGLHISISGTKHDSGCDLIGGSTATFDWIAVGL